MDNPTVWTPLNPQKFVRGDGKVFWRPVIEKRRGDYVERFAMTRTYDGTTQGYVKEWRTFDFYSNSQNAVLYRSKTWAERIAVRATKRFNKVELKAMEAVPYEF